MIDFIATMGTKDTKVVREYRDCCSKVFRDKLEYWRDNVDFTGVALPTIHFKVWVDSPTEEVGSHLALRMVVGTPEEAYRNICTILRTIILVVKVEITW